jgi:hypothetical protein
MVKAQLSIDYVIVFSFVLIIFVLIFGLVATQRVEQSQQQDYAQLQVIAQTIAQDINTASSLGNGYAQNVSLPSGAGLVNYNLSITSSGTVIVYNNATGKLSYAYAYAPVARVISSQQYESPNAIHTYNMPVASGLIYLQNSHGDICIDYVCNTTYAQGSGLDVYTKVTHVAQMNGQDSYIYVANSPSLLQPFVYNAITMSAWVYVKQLPPSSGHMAVVNYGTSQQGSYCFGPMIYVSNNNIYGGFQNINRGSSEAFLPIKSNTWYFVAWTYSDATNKLALYVNGRKTIANGVVPLDSASYIYNLVLGSTDYTYNSGQGACQSGTPFSGSVSDLQIYSTALNSNQITQLQNGGINGAPVRSDNLSAWWPLNGNANDYSGNGNDGRAYQVVYPTVAQIYANVTNVTLSPVKGDLVGFSSTLGSFEGNGQSASNFTNNNGIATAFLMQTNNTGYANVKVTPFEGNAYTAKNLSGWWPLNTNQGNVIFNFANSLDPGTLENGYWNNVNYVGQFTGYDSYVNVADSASLDPTNSVTLAAWVYPKRYSADNRNGAGIIAKGLQYEISINASGYAVMDGVLASTPIYSGVKVPIGEWSFVVGSLNSNGTATICVNTACRSNSGTGSNLVVSKSPLYIGYGTILPGAVGTYFNGAIANAQVYDASLSESQISLLYHEGISGMPLLGGLVGWWPLNGNTNDYSSNNDNGFGTGSFRFVSQNMQQTVPNNTARFLATGFSHADGSYMAVNNIKNYADVLTTGSFTITAWIKLNSCTGWESVAGDSSASTGFQFYACTDAAALEYVLLVGGQIVKWTGYGGNGLPSFPLNTWEMVTAEYNGSTGQVTVYLDNTTADSAMLSAHLNLAQSVPFDIGNSYSSGEAYALNGSMANVQLYSVPLSKKEVSMLYNSGIYGMPRPNDGLVGWWPLNGNANDYSGNGNNGTENATTYEYLVNPSAIPSLNSYGVSSLGSGNAIVADNHNYQHFSIASWVYLDQPVSGPGVYLGTPGSSNYGLFRTSSKQGFTVGGGSATSNNVTTFPIGKWTYVVGTFDGKNVSYYADGVLLAKGTSSSGIPSSPIIVGPNLAGSVANIEYYNVSLTSGQVYQLYNNQLPITYTEQIPLSWGT